MNLARLNSIRRLQSCKVEEARGVVVLRQKSAVSVKWGIANALAAFIFYCNLLQFLSEFFLSLKHDWIPFTDLTLAILFSMNALTNLYFYVSPALHNRSIALSPQQKELLGLDGDDKNFPDHQPIQRPKPDDERHFSSCPNSSFGSSRHYFPRSHSPGSYSNNRSPHGSFQGGSISPKQRLNFSQAESPQQSDMNRSLFKRTSPFHSTISGSPLQISPAGVTQRMQELSPIQRHVSQEDSISDCEMLDSFIKEQNLLNASRSKSSPRRQTQAHSQSAWNYGQMVYNFIPSFGSYQLATRQAKISPEEDDSLSPFDEVWSKIGIARDNLDSWTENLRKWLAETILEKLVAEIQTVNATLVQIGCSEMQIGNTSVSSLRGLSLSKAAYVPSLSALLPYLEIGTNQEYLVERLKELSTGGCLRVYKWDSGGQYKGKEWSQDLPTDAQIVMHLFNTYMDTQLPGNPLYPDGKSFSGMHHMKPSDKNGKQSDIYLNQTRLSPPHFKVVAQGTTYEMPKGRSNLFHSIVVFLHFIKVIKLGMLERVNLGLSGINVLWILNRRH